ncbi:MAG: hypothetical protein IH899_13675 [Planctomycetes bacterium]|nr:hypothetical protein [Planctomycetota bacterium]
MALTNSTRPDKREPESQSFEVASAVEIFIGAYVVIDNSGFARNPADTSGFEPVGFVIGVDAENADQTSVTGDGTDAFEVAVDISGTIVERLSVAGVTGQSDVRRRVFLVDENTFRLSPATVNLPPVGMITRFRSTSEVDVLFFSLEQMRGN